MNWVWSLGMVVLGSVLASSCAMGSLSLTDCRPGEPSTNCCIKKFPLSPVESCGATMPEVDLVLKAMSMALTVEMAAQKVDDDAEEDDFANNKDLPEWKQECIRGYSNCKEYGWTGNCYECLRFCEGQRAWPIATCGPGKSTTKKR
ncbi:hypothetical protein ACN28I_35185 [Archangium gephyra]|uniref:hypothetical protein n=1 Tax=Archangium gephyra TaxID=48 RepID=UPI003B7B7FEE